jgi:ATP-dependent RNA helicase SUPV3L1/SUV3
MASARRALAREVPGRLRRLEAAGDDAFQLAPDGRVLWDGAPVARLAAGDHPLAPRIQPLPFEPSDGPSRERLRRRLAAWLDALLRRKLEALFRLREASLTGAARGLSFQLDGSLGAVTRAAVAPQVAALTRAERQQLAKIGVRIGRESVWLPQLQRHDAPALLGLLWATHHHRRAVTPDPARPSHMPRDGGVADGQYLAIGYRVFGGHAVGLDALERLSIAAHRLSRQGPFALPESLRPHLGGDRKALERVLAGLGFRCRSTDGGVEWYRASRNGTGGPAPANRSAKMNRARRKRRPPPETSPFARLKVLAAGR